jgi:ribose transport system ATP-binding protein
VPRPGEEEKIVELMLGTTAASSPRRSRRAREAEVSVEAPRAEGRGGERSSWSRNLVVGTTRSGVSFELRAGEILGVAALEGQGQDLLFDNLAGERRPRSGEMVVAGKPSARAPVRGDPRRRRARARRPHARLLPQRPIRRTSPRRSTTGSRAGADQPP